MENNSNISKISNIFYSKKSQYAKSTKIEKRREIITTNPIPSMEQIGILGYTQLFKVYNKQSNALSYAKENGMGLMVFAYEGVAVGEGGRRNFLVCHPRKLWNNIKNRPLHYRCTYEVIPENCYCKLYFDLEYSKNFNPNLNGSEMVSLFISIINSFIFQEFGIICNSENILDLESSTSKKFSRHLIYNHPQLYFENNGHVGRFVNEICKYLKQVYNEEVPESKIPNISVFDIKKLFVKTESSVTLFCDQGVYTKNRNFRILGSTKLRKDSPLVVSPENKYKPHLHTENEDENWFIDSLVTYVPPSIETIKYGFDTTAAYTKSVSSCSKSKQDNVSNKCSCPYPEIQNYINNFLGGENLVRSWRYFDDGELLIFDIDKRHRYCNNIGREHKSNSIMYVVNLRLGIFYQKCHDPDCKNFRSNEMKLPLETMPWKSITEDGFLPSDDDGDDDFLAAAAEEIEKEHTDVFSTSKNSNNSGEKKPKNIFITPKKKNDNSSSSCSRLPSPWNHLYDVKVLPVENSYSSGYNNNNIDNDDDDDDVLAAAAQEIEATTLKRVYPLCSSPLPNVADIKHLPSKRKSPVEKLESSSLLLDTVSDEEMMEACDSYEISFTNNSF